MEQLAGIGHNFGPAMDRGFAYRRHQWAKARADLLPKLPLEILKLRVNRAKELGLDYTTYASVRASTGHDVIGFLFSTNALRAFSRKPQMPQDRTEKLDALRHVSRVAIVQPPLDVEQMLSNNPEIFASAHVAPRAAAPWQDIRTGVLAAVADAGRIADRVILIGDTALEREWSEAGRLAGYLPSERFFGA